MTWEPFTTSVMTDLVTQAKGTWPGDGEKHWTRVESTEDNSVGRVAYGLESATVVELRSTVDGAKTTTTASVDSVARLRGSLKQPW